MKKSIIIVLLCMSAAFTASAQKVIDGVIAVVGNEPILRSDVEVQLHQLKDLNKEDVEKARCFILDQLMQKKLLLTKAKLDSLKVTDEQVEGELDRRIQYFVSQFGSEEKFESFYNKSIPEFKNEFRDAVKEQLLTEQMQNKVVGNVDVTPSDVRKFYKSLPEDSLPYYNTEMELEQIVIYPKVSKEEKKKAYDELNTIRQEILNGSKFSIKAIAYSEDPGSAVKGGDLGWQRASNYVPEFSAVAMSLKKDSISDVFETKYGYHIIQMIERKGDMIHVRHILIKPKVSEVDRGKAKAKLDSIRHLIVTDSLGFTAAAYKFSEDEETKNRGGAMVDPKTNASRIPVDELDANIFFAIDKLSIGEVSAPVAYTTMPEGKEAFRIIRLKSKTPPHKANLDDDYPKIKQMALEYEKADVLDKWMTTNIPKIYAHINDDYANCEMLEKWKEAKGVSFSKQ